MDASLRIFVSQLVGAAAAVLLLMAAVAFLSMPFALGRHPGEDRPAGPLAGQHLT